MNWPHGTPTGETGTSPLALKILRKFDLKAIALLQKYGLRFGYILTVTEAPQKEGEGSGFNIISNGYAAYRNDPKMTEACLKILKDAVSFIETGKVQS
jgi:hypothetical protein